MVSHCPTCTCEPVTWLGIERSTLLVAFRLATISLYLAIALFIGEFLMNRGVDDWDKLRLNVLRAMMTVLALFFGLAIFLHSIAYWDCIWSLTLGIWYVTKDFVTNPFLRFRDRFIRRRVDPEARVSGPVNDCATGDDPPTFPPKRKAVLRGEHLPTRPLPPLPTIRIDRQPTSLTTSRDQQGTEAFGILPPSEPVTSPPVHKPQSRKRTPKKTFRERVKDIVNLGTITESEEPKSQAGASRSLDIPLSRLVSKPSLSGATSEETSFSSITDHSEVERRSRISKYRDARKTSRTDEQISAEESLPLFREYENLSPSGEIAHTQASGSKDIQMKRAQTSRSYVPVSTFGKTQSFQARNVEKHKDQRLASSHGQTSTETLRHQSGSQIECGEVKQSINQQKTAARSYVPVSTLRKPTSELHAAAAKFEREPRRDTEQPAMEEYMISNILLKIQGAPDQEKMPSETVAEESRSVQPSSSNVLGSQNTSSLAESLPRPSSSVSRAPNRNVQIPNRPNLHLSSGFIVESEEGATAAGSIINSQVFEVKYDQLEEDIDASHIEVTVRFDKQTREAKYKKAGEIEIKPSGDQPALKQTCEVKRLENLEQTSTSIPRESYVGRRAREDFSLTGVSSATDAPAQIHQSMPRPTRDAASSSTGIEETSREISRIGRPSLHLSSGVTIVRDDSAEGRQSPEIKDIYDQPNKPIDATDLDNMLNPSTDDSE